MRVIGDIFRNKWRKMSLKARPKTAPSGKAGRPRRVPADMEAEEEMN